MNAVLVKCNTFRSDKGFGFQLGLLYVASFVNRVSDHRVYYYDMQLDDTYQTLADFIQSNSIAVVGITCNSHERFHVYDLARQIKRDFASLKIVVGGPHHTIVREFPADVPVDFYVFNDGERTFLNILDALQSGKSQFTHIQDMACASDGTYHVNPLEKVNRDIDDISMIDWTLLKRREEYELVLPIRDRPRIVPLLSSRGCPYNCGFCAARQINYKMIRWMSPNVFVDELEKALQVFPNRIVFIYDDHFLLNKKRLIRMADEIKSRGLSFEWGAYTRADAIDEEKVAIAKEIGCRMLSFGFESGSDKVLKLMNKGITASQEVRALRTVKKSGIVTRCSLMNNFPGETFWDFLKTILTLIRAGVKGSEIIHANNVILFPGTAVFGQLLGKYLPADFSWERRYANIPMYKDVPIYDSWLIRMRTKIKTRILKLYRLLAR